jgi:hypothetical protein
MPGDFSQRGVQVLDGYLPQSRCTELLDAIREYRRDHALPLIDRKERGRSLRYMVIDGDRIHRHLPEFEELYVDVNAVVNRLAGVALRPLANRGAAVNVNITPPGGEYRWHYDRNAVTAILYLNESAGGETEMYPNYRLHLGKWKHTRMQRWLDALLRRDLAIRLFGRKLLVAPQPGRLIAMRGDRCLHSVRPVEGDGERINIVMTFDLPGAVFHVEKNLDPYLYSRDSAPAFDPNYRP